MKKVKTGEAARAACAPAPDEMPVKNFWRFPEGHKQYTFISIFVTLFALSAQLLRGGFKTFETVSRGILDILIPPRCPLSGETVAAPDMISARGWAQLTFAEEPFCAKCGAPFATQYGEGFLCAPCIAEPPQFDCARAALVYNDNSHKLIVGFKHADRTEFTPVFVRWLLRAGKGLITEDAIILPIPLHPRRLLSRRYNQSALLAFGVGRLTGNQVRTRYLLRKRHTPPQKDLSAAARVRNVAGAFFVPPGVKQKIRGAKIILVDDVLTTGATLSSAARTLKAAGAARVNALVLARVVKGGGDAL